MAGVRRKLTGDHCQCGACGEFFNSTYAFDRHRAGEWGERYCLTPEAMQNRGMCVSTRGWWISTRKETVGNAVSSERETQISASEA